MKKHLHKLILFSATACLSACTAQEPLTDYVDPRIGTAHSRWFFFTPAAVPFGMAKLAPTTDGHLGNPNGWEAVGYDSRHTSIEGFANFHEFQVGGVVVAPTVGELQTVPGPLDNPDAGYRSRFDKKDEVARPGYYSVLLKDYGVKAELTATERVGFHRYTFPATEEANLIFNIGTRMGESGPVRDASVTYTDDGRIEGWVVTEPAYVDIYQKGATVTMYFSAVLDAEPAAWGAFSGEQTFAGERSRTGVGAGLYLRFDTRERQQVGLKIGLSYTSVENARLNLEKEAARKDFDRVRREANDTWEEALGRLRVEGGLHDDRVKFYTGLFHALLGRGLASDVNGAYPANDGMVGQIALDGAGRPVHDYYNTDAIWGAYWNLTQLWSIAYPEYYADWVASQLLVYKDAGWLGDGIACSKYVSGVGTNFTGLAIAAAYNCGIRNFDVALGYQAARKNELGSEGRPAGAGKLDVGKFVSQGYSPYLPELGMQTTPDGSGFAASHTLEYSFSAYAVAQMARQLGHEADYEQLEKLSGGWELLFDPETKYIRPRDHSGEFIADFCDKPENGIDIPTSVIYDSIAKVQNELDGFIKNAGTEDMVAIRTRMQDLMTSKIGIFRRGEDMESAVAELEDLLKKTYKVSVKDKAGNNPELVYAYRTRKMLKVALAIACGAAARKESRGAHFREDYPVRNDAEWLCRTIATWKNENDTLPTLSYEKLDVSKMELPPGWRGYGAKNYIDNPETPKRQAEVDAIRAKMEAEGADRYAIQDAIMPFHDLLPKRLQGKNERIDEPLA